MSDPSGLGHRHWATTANRSDATPYSFLGIAGLTAAVTTVGILPWVLTGALVVQMRSDIDLSVTDLGVATGIFFLAGSATSFVAGRKVETIGAVLGMRVAVLLSALVCAGISFAHSRWLLFSFLWVGGVANATTQVAANLHLAREVVTSRQGLGFGIKQGSLPAASLIAGIAVPGVALKVGWEWAFRLAASVAILIAILIPSTERKHRRPIVKSDIVGSTRRALLLLAAGSGLGCAASNSLGAFFVDSAVDGGLSEGTAGLFLAAGSLVGLAARVAVGWAADRRQHGRLLWVAGMLAVGAIGYGFLSTRALWAVIPATALCFAGGWGWPGLLNFAVVIRNPNSPAAATGLTLTGAYLGAIVGPLLFGLVAEVDYSIAWAGAVACGLSAAAIVIVARRALAQDDAASRRPLEIVG